MATKNKEKKFDAVKMMREIRDEISAETQNMTLEELKNYIEKNTKNNIVSEPRAPYGKKK